MSANGQSSYGSAALATPGVMLLSAGIFGFFGFATSWAHSMTTTDPPQLIPMVVLLKWTLRGAAIGFLIAALMTMAHRLAGNLLYSVVGIISALLFLVVAVWDMNSTYYSGVHWFLLLIFAIWNGYGSFAGLSHMVQLRRDRDLEREPADVPIT